jgi:hypothetical protein
VTVQMLTTAATAGWSLSSLDLYAGRDLLPTRASDGAVSTDPADYPVHATFDVDNTRNQPGSPGPRRHAVDVDAPHRDALRPGNFLMAHARVCRTDGSASASAAAA